MSAGGRALPLVERWLGLDLSRGGQGEAVERFVAERVAALSLPSAEAYLSTLSDPACEEAQRLVSAVTIHHTWFFRDPQQLSHIVDLLRTRSPAGRPLHLWVAGCATGEDAYSMALLLAQAERAVHILGSDISAATLRRAAQARYPRAVLDQVPEALHGHFLPVAGGGGLVEVEPRVRAGVRFQLHNLVGPALRPPAPATGWDLILCRNVLIYFQPARAQDIISELAGSLAPEGLLLLGACEVLRAPPPGLQVADLGARYALRRASEPPVAPACLGSPSAPPPPCALTGGPCALSAPAPALGAPAPSSPSAPPAAQAPAPAPEGLTARALSCLQYGVARYVAKDLAAAVQALREARELSPALWAASFYLALSYERQGRRTEALLEFQRVVEEAAAPSLGREELPGELAPWREDMMALAQARLRSAGRSAQGPLWEQLTSRKGEAR